MGRAEAVELGEALALGLQALHDGLDDEVGVAGGLLEIRLEPHARDGLLHLVLGHLALLHAPLELLAVARHPLLQHIHGQIVQREGVAVQGRLHGDLRAHLARAHHQDALDVVGLHGVVSSAQSSAGFLSAQGAIRS